MIGAAKKKNLSLLSLAFVRVLLLLVVTLRHRIFMSLPSEYQALLSEKGIHLHFPGIYDVAFKREDAIQAVEVLSSLAVPILGGDVYFRQGPTVSLAYGFWHCDPNLNEDRNDFVLRSCAKALEYIKKFPDSAGKEVLFVLVPKK